MNLNEENLVMNDLLKEQILHYMQESSSLLGLLHVFQNSLYSDACQQSDIVSTLSIIEEKAVSLKNGLGDLEKFFDD